LAHTPSEKQDEAVFDIINHLNRGAALVTSQDEREQIAELNLIAGRRARASTAFTSALNYLAAGSALLPADCWERRHPLAFSLELHRAECEFVIRRRSARGAAFVCAGRALRERQRACHRRAPAGGLVYDT
jgi:predicted ATPase